MEPLIATLRAGLGQPQDVARLVRWTEPLRKSPERLLAGADMSLGESLDRHGISGRIREEVGAMALTRAGGRLGLVSPAEPIHPRPPCRS